MTPEEFISWLAPAAQAQCKPYNLPASVLISQGALESGWGRYKIGEYNIFGRKWGGWGNYIEKTTWECYNGEWQQITAKFQGYESLLQACDDWCILITQEPYYADAWAAWYNSHDVEQFVRALVPVYATDPDYADKVLSTIWANNLTQYD
ncbi:glycoside hydrolase family 73 protein [Sporomusa aerivorans]|uniref:glycoside hydrolase family 73 protein n=1 Tax=Sporomusa aerivorans TaxID=204936 RepID=UPI00352B56B9